MTYPTESLCSCESSAAFSALMKRVGRLERAERVGRLERFDLAERVGSLERFELRVAFVLVTSLILFLHGMYFYHVVLPRINRVTWKKLFVLVVLLPVFEAIVICEELHLIKLIAVGLFLGMVFLG